MRRFTLLARNDTATGLINALVQGFERLDGGCQTNDDELIYVI
jgi:hypothetical protein